MKKVPELFRLLDDSRVAYDNMRTACVEKLATVPRYLARKLACIPESLHVGEPTEVREANPGGMVWFSAPVTLTLDSGALAFPVAVPFAMRQGRDGNFYVRVGEGDEYPYESPETPDDPAAQFSAAVAGVIYAKYPRAL